MGFEWSGSPTGCIGKIANNEVYIIGDNPDAVVMIIHDLLGWTFPNVRLLADHYTREANVTVYVPDFFGGEALPFESVINSNWNEIDFPGFLKKNSPKSVSLRSSIAPGPCDRSIKGSAPWASVTGNGLSSAWVRRSISHHL
jgi:hypothetical protein